MTFQFNFMYCSTEVPKLHSGSFLAHNSMLPVYLGQKWELFARIRLLCCPECKLCLQLLKRSIYLNPQCNLKISLNFCLYVGDSNTTPLINGSYCFINFASQFFHHSFPVHIKYLLQTHTQDSTIAFKELLPP